MKKLHQRLRQKYPWYHKWHKHPKHNLFHWLSLIAFSELAIVFALAVTVVANGGTNTTKAGYCARQAPAINIHSPMQINVHPGGTDNFNFTVAKNNNCPTADIFVTTISISPEKSGLTLSDESFTDTLPKHGSNIAEPLIFNANHQFSITSDASAAPGARKITITSKNTTKVRYPLVTVSDPIIYNLVSGQPPEGLCVTAPLTLKVGESNPPGGTGAPGDALLYDITATNNDSTACRPRQFQISATSDPSLKFANNHPFPSFNKLDPGKSDTQPMLVRALETAQPGVYNFSIFAFANDMTPISNTATGTFTVKTSVGANPDKCTPAAPQLTLADGDSRKTGIAGTALTYNVTVTNMDSAKCGGSKFSMYTKFADGPGTIGWTSSADIVSPTTFSLEAGQHLVVPVTITSAANAGLLDYGFAINVTGVPTSINDPHRALTTATYGVVAASGTPPLEPTISVTCTSGCASPTLDPATNSLQVFGPFTLSAQVTATYKISDFFYRLDGMGLQPHCPNSSVCSHDFITTAWALNSPHDINIIALKADGSRAAKPLPFTVTLVTNPNNPQVFTSTINLTAVNTTVPLNGQTTLSWTITPAAVACHTGDNWKNADQNNGALDPSQLASGSRVTPPITADTTFTLFCTSPNGADVQAHVDIKLASVGNPPPASGDTAAPKVSLDKPSTGQLYGSADLVRVRTTASDNVAVTKISIILNGTELNSCDGDNVTSCPFSFAAGNFLEPGPNTISARAFDAAGNSADSSATIYGKANVHVNTSNN